MKTFTRLLSLAVIGGILMTCMPASADTAYHPVYERSEAVGDIFSILDINHNNALLSWDYNANPGKIAFTTVDGNGDGFLSRDEYYSHYDLDGNTVSGGANMTAIAPAAGDRVYTVTRYRTTGEGLNEMMPAAGGDERMYNRLPGCDRPTAALNGDDGIYPAACGIE